MLEILVWLGILFLAGLLAAIFLPLRLELRAEVADKVSFSALIRPFGRFGPRIPLRRNKTAKAAPQEAERKPRRESKTRRLDSGRRLLRPGLRLLGDILGAVRVHTMAVDLRFGSDDPSETGEIFGWMAPIVYGTAAWNRADLHFEPVFDGEVFEGSAALDVSLVPARLVPPFVRFGFAAFGPTR